jgi:hypothetical protein
MKIFQMGTNGSPADTHDEVADKADIGILHMLHRFRKIVRVDLNIAVADEDILKSRGPICTDQVIHLWVQSIFAPLNDDRNPKVLIPLLYLLSEFVRGVVLVLQRKDNLILGIIQIAEAFEIVKKVIVKAFERLQDGYGWLKCRVVIPSLKGFGMVVRRFPRNVWILLTFVTANRLIRKRREKLNAVTQESQQ